MVLCCDTRIAGETTYTLIDDPSTLMQIPPSILKSVLYVGAPVGIGYECLGTAFLVSKPIDPSYAHCYLVTAKHNLSGFCDQEEVPLRINLTNGSYTWLKTIRSEWICHPTDDSVDVAVRKFEFSKEFDAVPFSLGLGATNWIMKFKSLNVGRQVFLAGLFYPHQGKTRNVPIIRVGNIASLPQEKVMTEDGPIDAYLVEVRSMGGISGSPVFVYFEQPSSKIDDIVEPDGTLRLHTPVFYLLGLMHGHFWDPTTARADKMRKEDVLNMGIAIVVPFEKIDEVLMHPAILEKEREDAIARYHSRKGIPTKD